MIDGFNREVNIKIRPIQMMRVRQLDIQELADRHISKPGKVFEGQKDFAIVNEQPKAML
jgi:hypothetical protein